ncbi:MAG: hypothetical protein A3H28_07930 [Acidobacteria bacterium RIFCSPLOWO2_02_FULL_61_28]|nr:MAG: hypothetical protein A3H28_07930 [Acidobacteria bacterium RIFCSPLOWO2_02_FULL_61_28]
MENEIANNKRHSREQLEELLKILKLEEETVAAGGYRPSATRPHPRPFLDSMTTSCLQFGSGAMSPCDLCWLMEFVPREHLENVLVCYQIPLNQNGDTVASLEATGDYERLEQAILTWVRGVIAKLEQELKQMEENKVSMHG